MRNLTHETKTMEISESDSLVLWRALQMYQNAITSNSALADENDAERVELLQAKMIYLALEFAGTLDGRTFGDIYKEVSGT